MDQSQQTCIIVSRDEAHKTAHMCAKERKTPKFKDFSDTHTSCTEYS